MSQASSLVNCLAGIRSKQPWLVMTSAEKFSLSESSNPAISHFYSFEASDSSEATMAIPDGCVDILFDCDTNRPSAEVFGTPMSASEITLNSGHRYFGVRFVSGVILDRMKASAKEMINRHYNFLEVFSESNQIFDEMVSSHSFIEQTTLIEAFIAQQAIRESSPLTSRVRQCIEQSKGRIRISELEEMTGYTTRTIERQFQADMGMSPKAFCRIIRCQSAVYDINHGQDIRFSDLACDLGFSDQSHFLREFKKQVNTTPRDYLMRVRHESYLARIEHFRPEKAH